MAAQAQLPTAATTPRGRLSYPAIFTAQLNKLSGKMEFSAQALFEEGADLTELKLMAKNACINKWGADESKWPTAVLKAEAIAKWGPDPTKWQSIPPMLKSPFKSQADLITAAEKKGQSVGHLNPKAIYMTFKTSAVDKAGKPRPHPVVVGKNPKEVITEESKFYPGCWAKFNVNAGAYANGNNFGVTFYLNACQFVGDAEPFSGKASPEAAFEAIPEDTVAATPGATGSATDMFS